MAKLKDEYKEEIDVKKIKKKLIENGYIFRAYEEKIFDYNLMYEAAVAADIQNYGKCQDILLKLMDIYYIEAFRFYAEILVDNLHKKSEGKEIYKRAADFGDI